MSDIVLNLLLTKIVIIGDFPVYASTNIINLKNNPKS